MTKEDLCIVVWDDDDHIFPMGWDADCQGAICSCSSVSPIAVFNNHKEARTAIRISTAFAKLCKEQGKSANVDFLGDCLKNIKIKRLARKPRS